MSESVIQQMSRSGQLEVLAAENVDAFVAGNGVKMLLFSGGESRAREAHDVAVVMRELLRTYDGLLSGAVVEVNSESEIASRFRVLVKPSLVMIANGEAAEVLPGIRDWGDYAAAVARYLGPPDANSKEVNVS